MEGRTYSGVDGVRDKLVVRTRHHIVDVTVRLASRLHVAVNNDLFRSIVATVFHAFHHWPNATMSITHAHTQSRAQKKNKPIHVS